VVEQIAASVPAPLSSCEVERSFSFYEENLRDNCFHFIFFTLPLGYFSFLLPSLAPFSFPLPPSVQESKASISKAEGIAEKLCKAGHSAPSQIIQNSIEVQSKFVCVTIYQMKLGRLCVLKARHCTYQMPIVSHKERQPKRKKIRNTLRLAVH
jgi:hypothetical protein